MVIVVGVLAVTIVLLVGMPVLLLALVVTTVVLVVGGE